MIHDVDLILIEGYKQESIPRIGLCRKATGKGLPGSAEDYVAIATDDDALLTGALPRFSLDDVDGIADFILQYTQLDPSSLPASSR